MSFLRWLKSWFFCAHDWREVARTYARPLSYGERVGVYLNLSMTERAIHGFTTILYECPRCMERYREVLLGSEAKKPEGKLVPLSPAKRGPYVS